MDGQDKERRLDSDGIIQAKSLTKKLLKNFDGQGCTIISSPFLRAIQSIDEFAKELKVEIKTNFALEEIQIGKEDGLTKHEVIKKMWSNENYKSSTGHSHSQHISKIKNEINKIIEDFYKSDESLVLISHGNSLGIILKNFLNVDFNFEKWKRMTMPDLYELKFKNNELINFKRDVEDIENIFSV